MSAGGHWSAFALSLDQTADTWVPCTAALSQGAARPAQCRCGWRLACAHGVQAGHLNQPIQVAALRPRLQALVGEGFPQLLRRLGYPTNDQAPSPRLPLDAVMVEAPAQRQRAGSPPSP